MKEHPAKFSDAVVEQITEILIDEVDHIGHPPVVVDPFAGIGKIEEAWHKTVGLELEWEWAEQGGCMIQGNALNLPFAPGSIEVFATSPCYGNRFADHHNAQEKCRPCNGSGEVITRNGPDQCMKCSGRGRRIYDRHTYKHKLGRMPSKDSSAVMQWGKKYRRFHRKAWRELDRALCPGGLFVLNIGDHIRGHKRQRVSRWHYRTIKKMGYICERRIKVETPKMKKGANRDARVPYEYVLAFRKV